MIDVRDEQLENALFGIDVPLVIATSFRLLFLICDIAKAGICALSIGQPLNA